MSCLLIKVESRLILKLKEFSVKLIGMNKTNYKVILDMGWEYIVTADDRTEAMSKVKQHVKSLFTEDGYSDWSFKAQGNINDNKYSIEEYTVFILP